MVSTNPGSAKTSTKAANRAEANGLEQDEAAEVGRGRRVMGEGQRIAGHCELHAREWDIMAAGVSNRLREVADIVALVGTAEVPAKKRGSYKKAKALA